ncbi:unnamed protein product [Arabidopsis thaliana]|uniref:Uncharacterized protein n=1 Tax=Arabidopsis thaliana TaxID=3702 RepID=A0A5S9Y8I1_ARATH|nr:unnamed protein product [Arabidopsis thaliana]
MALKKRSKTQSSPTRGRLHKVELWSRFGEWGSGEDEHRQTIAAGKGSGGGSLEDVKNVNRARVLPLAKLSSVTPSSRLEREFRRSTARVAWTGKRAVVGDQWLGIKGFAGLRADLEFPQL